MLKFLRISCIILLFLFFGVLVYGKLNIKHLDYDEYINNKYFPSSYSIALGYKLDNYLIDDESINNLDDLMKASKYVLIVDVYDKPIFKGKAIINNCNIKEVLKGDFKVNDNIKIYDLISFYGMNSSDYLGGTTPLRVGEKYAVFITDDINSSEDDIYAFSSVKYPHFNLSEDVSILENYNNNKALTVLEASYYDYIFYEEFENDGKFTKIKEELLNYISK